MTPEDRISGALHAYADGSPLPADAELRLAENLRREHRRRRVGGALLAAASTVAVVALAALLVPTGGRGPAPTPALGSASPSAAPPSPAVQPSRAASAPPVTQAPVRFAAVEADGSLSFHDSRTGVRRGGVPGLRTVTALAGGGDGTTYYVATSQPRCGPTDLLRQTVPSVDGSSVQSHPVAQRLPGAVRALAVSQDGTKLAYAITTKALPDGSCGQDDLRVLDLRTGATRVWRAPAGRYTASQLAWAPDGRTLTFFWSVCCAYQPAIYRLDTAAAGSRYDTAPRLPFQNTAQQYCPVSQPAWSSSELFAVRGCGSAGSAPAGQVVVLDPATGRVVRVVATVPGADFAQGLHVTRDGRHLLLATGSSDYRIDGGVVSRLSTALSQVDW
jgi:hypothetical protein